MPEDQTRHEKAVPTVPFRVLDAPNLKDDYYCSILAYSHTCHTLAVALSQKVYLWTEQYGVRYPPIPPARASNFVTSLAFSSEEGGKAILAVARNSGAVTLWSLLESRPRFEAPHPSPASCVSFKPIVTQRPSATSGYTVSCEDLLVGDDIGKIYYYSLEWHDFAQGSMTLLAKIDAHSQNVCGLAWSPDGRNFASGGNDNRALLFDANFVLQAQHASNTPDEDPDGDIEEDSYLHADNIASLMTPRTPARSLNSGTATGATQSIDHTGRQVAHIEPMALPTPPPTPMRGRNTARSPNASHHGNPQRHETTRAQSVPLLRNDLANSAIPGLSDVHIYSFYHAAAVKAIAFAPWQPTLLATGGGSNDRQIHFFHTGSGATLAIINVFSQITSLVWSGTRREIVATFGYSQPEHEVRIAVFSWPRCECVVSIPWERKQNGEIGRALWAIPYPGGPNDAIPTRRQSEIDGFAAWEAVRIREVERRRLDEEAIQTPEIRVQRSPAPSPDTTGSPLPTPPARRTRLSSWARPRDTFRRDLRSEGEAWASRTEDEGSLIIACCDQTVKFFEVWAGKSRGRGRGLGNRKGVLGGSRVLEGWCESVGVDEIGIGENVIR